jgi:hypothetical protein
MTDIPSLIHGGHQMKSMRHLVIGAAVAAATAAALWGPAAVLGGITATGID